MTGTALGTGGTTTAEKSASESESLNWGAAMQREGTDSRGYEHLCCYVTQHCQQTHTVHKDRWQISGFNSDGESRGESPALSASNLFLLQVQRTSGPRVLTSMRSRLHSSSARASASLRIPPQTYLHARLFLLLLDMAAAVSHQWKRETADQLRFSPDAGGRASVHKLQNKLR